MDIKTVVRQIIDQKTKPIGALGLLEDLALQLACIQQCTNPEICQPHVVVFAADHGIATTGLVNPYPQSVTAQMVQNFLVGGAAINVFCKQNGLELLVVDAGVNANFEATIGLVNAKLGFCTANYLEGAAITIAQLQLAKAHGAEIVEQIHAKGCNTICFGEMGIGNSSSAALIMHHICKKPLENCVGVGTGTNAQQYVKKLETLRRAAELHHLGNKAMPAEQLLLRIGGFEIAMMYAAYLKAAALSMVIVVDGFIATAALLCAHEYKNDILTNCVFAHSSAEAGHSGMLEFLGVKPLLQLGLRLGEGTGGALAMPLLQCACAFLNNMASFSEAGVSGAHQ